MGDGAMALGESEDVRFRMSIDTFETKAKEYGYVG